MSIPESVINEVRQRADIAEIASEFVELKRAGRSLTACCPFHQEKTPSFHVHQEDGYFKCFGCGKKGDVFSLLMELRGWSFPEAIQFLAHRYGVQIPSIDTTSEKRKETAKLRKVATAIASFYERTLWDTQLGAKARAYLESRGLSQEVCRTFRLGYADSRQDRFLQSLAELLPEYSADELERALHVLGVLRERDRSSGSYLMFRDRVMFPILRSDGCPIAFGGRIIDSVDGAPKYLNSPESPIYHKRKTLYGIAQAAKALRSNRTALIVEGYTDVLALHQAGIENVLASCGTAVAEEHALVLRRVADTAYILFDGDTAGRSAAARCFERFLNSGVELRVLFLPAGEDPDSLVRKEGSNAVLERVRAESQTALSAYLAHSLEQSKEDGIVHRANVAKEVMGLISKVTNPVEQDLMIQTVAEQLQVEPESLKKLRSMVQSRGTHSSHRSMGAASTRKNSNVTPPQLDNDPGNYGNDSQPPFGPQDFANYDDHVPFYSESSESDARPMAGQSSGAQSRAVRRGPSPIRKYLEQLIIAVVCNPAVARGIASIPSLLATAKLAEDKNESLQMLFTMVNEAEAPMGLQSALSSGEHEVVLEEWRAALTSCGIKEGRILQEALRQSRVGGIKFEELITGAELVRERSTRMEQLQVLRQAEASAGDAADRLNLAQEKLKARREMDKLASERGNKSER